MSEDDQGEELDLVRRLAEERLGHEIEDYQWQGLCDERFPLPDDTLSPEEGLKEAVSATVRAWQRLYSKAPRAVRQPRRVATTPDVSELTITRAEALNKIYVAEANQDEEVQSFRQDVLKGRLIPPDDPAFRESLETWLGAFEGGWQWLGALMTIRFPATDPDDRHHYEMPEPVRRLWKLTERLGKRYDWMKGEATRLVLARYKPGHYSLRASAKVPMDWPTGSRVTLVIDPMTPPEEVARFYQRFRKENIVGDTLVRPLKEKALHLAVFAMTCSGDERPADEARRWNAEHPEHAYDPSDPSQLGNFRRDMKQATERLLYPQWGMRRRQPKGDANG